MSTQTLKELARRELLAWNEGRLEVVDEIFAPTYVNHFTGETPATLKQKVAAVRAAFPDVQVAIDDQMVEGDRVVSRWTARGTQEGDFMGAPATHKRMEQDAPGRISRHPAHPSRRQGGGLDDRSRRRWQVR